MSRTALEIDRALVRARICLCVSVLSLCSICKDAHAQTTCANMDTEVTQWQREWQEQYGHISDACQKRFRDLEYWHGIIRGHCQEIAKRRPPQRADDLSRFPTSEEVGNEILPGADSAHDEAKAHHDYLQAHCVPDPYLFQSRLFVAVDTYFALTPSFGGDVAGTCSAPCTKPPGVGLLALGRFGRRFVSGFMLNVDAGYLLLTQKVTGRATTALVTGGTSDQGNADDSLRFSALVLGASGGVRLGSSVPVTLRFGSGILLGTLRDARTATFKTNQSPSVSYLFQATDSPPVFSLYVAPEARVAWKLGGHLELSLGVQALVVVAMTTPTWSQTFHAAPTLQQQGDGQASFSDVLTSKVMAVFAPGLGARYEF